MAENRPLSKTPALCVTSKRESLQMKDLSGYYEDVARRNVSPRMQQLCMAMIAMCKMASSETPTVMHSDQWRKLAETIHNFTERSEEIRIKDD